jgi:long-chain acyl-CoA synthetase
VNDSVTTTTLGDVLREQGRSRPGRVAVVDGDVRLTYAELNARVNQLAHVLTDGGLGAGDVVAWYGYNSFRVLELLLAAAKLGAALCPLNWRASESELAFIIDDLAPRVMVWQETDLGDVAAELRANSDATWICHDGQSRNDYEPLLSAA